MQVFSRPNCSFQPGFALLVLQEDLLNTIETELAVSLLTVQFPCIFYPGFDKQRKVSSI